MLSAQNNNFKGAGFFHISGLTRIFFRELIFVMQCIASFPDVGNKRVFPIQRSDWGNSLDFIK